MVPSATYSSGGYIEIVCPAAYITFTTTVVCNTIFGLIGSQVCTRYNDTVLYYQRAISSVTVISVSIFQVVNTLGAVQLPPFQIYFKESNGNIVSQNLSAFTYSTVAGWLSVTASSRSMSVLQVGLAGASYTVTFTC